MFRSIPSKSGESWIFVLHGLTEGVLAFLPLMVTLCLTLAFGPWLALGFWVVWVWRL